ncbi:hyaluronidase-like [Lycorma delicatula]|uniref:hyaluronidase-like n=1 Tax=Lycorma delicatula TaxID=130591 RepID=UPI003F515B5E
MLQQNSMMTISIVTFLFFLMLLIRDCIILMSTERSFNVLWGLCGSYETKCNVSISPVFNKTQVIVVHNPGDFEIILNTTVKNGSIYLEDSIIDKHIQKFLKDIEHIPSSYTGNVIIDMDHWEISWVANFADKYKIYKDHFLGLASDLDYTDDDDKEDKASRGFDSISAKIISKTINAAKTNSTAKWGFNGTPLCFQYIPGRRTKTPCFAVVQIENNNLQQSVYNHLDVFYPKMYLKINQDNAVNKELISDCSQECIRVARTDKTCIPFITYKYLDNKSFLEKDDLYLLLKEIKTEGSSAVVFGGNIDSEKECNKFSGYVNTTVETLVKNVTDVEKTQ